MHGRINHQRVEDLRALRAALATFGRWALVFLVTAVRVFIAIARFTIRVARAAHRMAS